MVLGTWYLVFVCFGTGVGCHFTPVPISEWVRMWDKTRFNQTNIGRPVTPPQTLRWTDTTKCQLKELIYKSENMILFCVFCNCIYIFLIFALLHSSNKTAQLCCQQNRPRSRVLKNDQICASLHGVHFFWHGREHVFMFSREFGHLVEWPKPPTMVFAWICPNLFGQILLFCNLRSQSKASETFIRQCFSEKVQAL